MIFRLKTLKTSKSWVYASGLFVTSLSYEKKWPLARFYTLRIVMLTIIALNWGVLSLCIFNSFFEKIERPNKIHVFCYYWAYSITQCDLLMWASMWVTLYFLKITLFTNSGPCLSLILFSFYLLGVLTFVNLNQFLLIWTKMETMFVTIDGEPGSH